MVNNSMFTRYRIALAGLCSCCAQMAAINKRMVDGKPVSENEVAYLCDRLDYSRHELLVAKEALGYNDGLSFMEDCRFKGFSIKDGCLEGNPKDVYKIIRPWYMNFPKEGNNYRFEVANYLLAFMSLSNEHSSNMRAFSIQTLGGVRKKMKHFLRKCRNFLLM